MNKLETIKKALKKNIFIEKKKNFFVKNNSYNYSKNFGIQWHNFQKTQYDSFTGYPLTKNRLLNSSKWKIDEVKDKLVIELGSGAGRFTEVLLSAGCYLVSVEMSDAILVNESNNKSNRALFIKSSLNGLEFLNNLFDFVLCYGVAQHTPNLFKTYKSCFDFGKKGSKISIDHYRKTFFPTTKKIWRPITKRINPKILLKIIKFYIPYYFQIDTFIKLNLNFFLRVIARIFLPIPCVNYTNIKNIPQEREKLIEWAIMDTFDALGAKYDSPLTERQLKNICKKIGLKNYSIKKNKDLLVLNFSKF